MVRRGLLMTAAVAGLLLAGYGSGFAQSAWEHVVGILALQGKPVAASPAMLSEHEVQELSNMTPQQQAERLLERATNHYEGAAEWIEKKDGSGELRGGSADAPADAKNHVNPAAPEYRGLRVVKEK